MKFKLLISSFLGVVAAVAMDSSKEGHDIHRLRGDVALAIVEARKKEKNPRKGEQPGLDYYQLVRPLPMFDKFITLSDSRLLEMAETEFSLAWKARSSLASSRLYDIYKTTNTMLTAKQVTRLLLLREMLSLGGLGFPQDIFVTCLFLYYQPKHVMFEDTLLLSQMNNKSGHKGDIGFAKKYLKQLKSNALTEIQHREKVDPDWAIKRYADLSSRLENAESKYAFGALIRLQSNIGTWLPLATGYFIRDMFEDSLDWMEKIVNQNIREWQDTNILKPLQSMSKNGDIPLRIRLRAAYLAYSYTQKNSENLPIGLHKKTMIIQKKELFSTALGYYNLLKEAKSQGDDVSAQIVEVGINLGRIAENNLSDHPDFLFQFALTQEEAVAEKDDISFIVGLYLRAANAGSILAREKLAASPHFLETAGAVEIAIFATQYCQGRQLLLSLYKDKRTTTPVYLVILALLLEKENDKNIIKEKSRLAILNLLFEQREYIKEEPRKEATELLAKHMNDYPPAMDLAIYRLLQGEGLDGGENHAKEKQQEIKEISTKKIETIDALSAEDQFNLAQEYKLINRVFEFSPLFSSIFDQKYCLDGYSFTLEKSAEKGYLPALEQLIGLYTKGYKLITQSPEKASFYQRIQEILEDTSLGYGEKMDFLEKEFSSKYTTKK